MALGGRPSGQPGGKMEGERLRAVELVRGGFALLGPRLQAVALVGAVSWICNVAWLLYVTPEREPQLGFLAQLIASLIGAAAVALMIRAMLTPKGEGGAGWARPDGGWLGYVALTTVVGLPMAYVLTGRGATPTAELPAPVLLGMLVLSLSTLIVSVKLSLWFVGVLIHRPVHPADSWRRTKGAVLGFILASIWLSLPPMAVAILIAGSNPDAAKNPASLVGVVMALATVVAEVLGASVTAALWRARGEGRLS